MRQNSSDECGKWPFHEDDAGVDAANSLESGKSLRGLMAILKLETKDVQVIEPSWTLEEQVGEGTCPAGKTDKTSFVSFFTLPTFFVRSHLRRGWAL